jgi:trans-aconitate methyltransferase
VHLDGGLAEARVLDFGCGWGRLTRLLARDVADDRLYGCDPVQGILDVCVRERVPAHFARNEVRSGRLPFDERFDLAFAFSVFTHLSEPAHEHALDALHAGLRPGGVLVVTVRPDDFLDGEAQYRFVAHPADAGHLQYQGGEMEYGESVVTLPYVRERWAPRFTLLKASLQLADLQQVVLVLRREGTP